MKNLLNAQQRHSITYTENLTLGKFWEGKGQPDKNGIPWGSGGSVSLFEHLPCNWMISTVHLDTTAKTGTISAPKQELVFCNKDQLPRVAWRWGVLSSGWCTSVCGVVSCMVICAGTGLANQCMELSSKLDWMSTFGETKYFIIHGLPTWINGVVNVVWIGTSAQQRLTLAGVITRWSGKIHKKSFLENQIFHRWVAVNSIMDNPKSQNRSPVEITCRSHVC